MYSQSVPPTQIMTKMKTKMRKMMKRRRPQD
jgi:hypothetical protein